MSTADLAWSEAGSGAPLVLLHAFPLSSAMWSGERAALADVARVVTPDQRGFGASALGEAAPSLDGCADDVVALLDRLGLDRVVLGGLSMGGYVAMALLRRHPERVAGLLLADTKAGTDPETARASRLRMADAVLDRGADVLVEEVVPALLGATTVATRPEVVERVTAMVREAPPAAAAWAQRAMAGRPDSFDVLRSVRVPALVVVGEEDVLSPVADARAMADAIPGAELVVVPGAGHLSSLEVPAVVHEAVRQLLART